MACRPNLPEEKVLAKTEVILTDLVLEIDALAKQFDPRLGDANHTADQIQPRLPLFKNPS